MVGFVLFDAFFKSNDKIELFNRELVACFVDVRGVFFEFAGDFDFAFHFLFPFAFWLCFICITNSATVNRKRQIKYFIFSFDFSGESIRRNLRRCRMPLGTSRRRVEARTETETGESLRF